MSIAPVTNISDAKAEKRKKDADALRDYADRVERGDVGDFAFVCDDVANRCMASFINFSDRWRVLGALEYAKAGVHRAGESYE